VPCRFRHSGDVLVGDADTAAQLYRIAQEGMRNAIRHAEATWVDISLVSDLQAVCLTVEDDGRGLPESESSTNSGMGLPIMAHRAAYIGASLSLNRTAGQGTRLACRVPASVPST
jgi:two-component system sensor histidine kinase UhpB